MRQKNRPRIIRGRFDIEQSILIRSESNSQDAAKDIAISNDKSREHNRNNRDQLDQDVQCWARGILERITNGVTNDGCLVIVRALAVDNQIAIASR